MNRYYAAYCLLLVALLAYVNANGYVMANAFDSHSGGHSSPGNHYHK